METHDRIKEKDQVIEMLETEKHDRIQAEQKPIHKVEAEKHERLTGIQVLQTTIRATAQGTESQMSQVMAHFGIDSEISAGEARDPRRSRPSWVKER